MGKRRCRYPPCNHRVVDGYDYCSTDCHLLHEADRPSIVEECLEWIGSF